MIYIATGVTPNYLKRAYPFIKSMEDHGSRNSALPALFAVDFVDSVGCLPEIHTIPVTYSEAALQLPKFMLQNGGFADFAPDTWRDEDVIIFCDADAVLQRPFNYHELDTFREVRRSQVLAGRNKPEDGQTLADEATCLTPLVGPDTLRARFPQHETMLCKNFGFVVARLDTWRELLEISKKLWPLIAESFSNPAMVQWMMCYATQSAGLELVDLPLSIHAHGHLGLPQGLACDNGIWKYHGDVVAYAHAL